MTQYERIGIDTSKAVFTLHGIDQQERPVLRVNRRRAQMVAFFPCRSTSSPPCRNGFTARAAAAWETGSDQ